MNLLLTCTIIIILSFCAFVSIIPTQETAAYKRPSHDPNCTRCWRDRNGKVQCEPCE